MAGVVYPRFLAQLGYSETGPDLRNRSPCNSVSSALNQSVSMAGRPIFGQMWLDRSGTCPRQIEIMQAGGKYQRGRGCGFKSSASPPNMC